MNGKFSPSQRSRRCRWFMIILGLLAVCTGIVNGTLPAAEPVALNPEQTVLLDQAGGKLLLKTKVCLRSGLLEMLVCPRQTKEHESILAIDGKAAVIHGGLLALGLLPGHPVRYQPELRPPEGPQIEIFVNWTDKEGKPHRHPAQDWVRQATHRYFEADLAKVPTGVVLDEGNDSLRYDAQNKRLLWFGTLTKENRTRFEAMNADPDYRQALQKIFEMSQPKQLKATFVFTGSAFRKRGDGKEIYLAEGGSVICVANFPDALIDVNIPSTSSNDAGLLFEPWTERIPDLGTEVTVELIPVKGPAPEQKNSGSAP